MPYQTDQSLPKVLSSNRSICLVKKIDVLTDCKLCSDLCVLDLET